MPPLSPSPLTFSSSRVLVVVFSFVRAAPCEERLGGEAKGKRNPDWNATKTEAAAALTGSGGRRPALSSGTPGKDGFDGIFRTLFLPRLRVFVFLQSLTISPSSIVRRLKHELRAETPRFYLLPATKCQVISFRLFASDCFFFSLPPSSTPSLLLVFLIPAPLSPNRKQKQTTTKRSSRSSAGRR